MLPKIMLPVSCLLVLIAGTSAAEESVESCRKLTAVFDALDLPRVAGKKFASFNTGKYQLSDGKVFFEYEPGWVVEDNEKEVTLFQENLEIATFRKDVPLPSDWDSLKKDHPKGCPLPRELMEFDFEEFCEDVLKEGIPTEKDDHSRSMARIGFRAWGGFSRPAGLVLKARWCLERNHPELAVKLVTLARESFESNTESRFRGERTPETTFEREVEVSVVENARWRAVQAANRGVPRKSLVPIWKLVAEGLPESPWREEAKKTVVLYERQLAEDATFVEIPPAELAKRDEASRVAYWIHKLRDLDARQWGQPGGVMIPTTDESASAQLVKLGWSAVSGLIAHLEDEGPTRCMSFYRDHALGSYELLRVADVCGSLLYTITGTDFPEHQRIYGPERRARVARDWKRWWDETGSKGAEKHFLALLDAGPYTYQRTVAAEGLLRLDRDRFLPILCKKLADMSPDERRWLLGTLTPYMGKEHEPLLLRFLEDEHAGVVLASAEALRSRCASERGTEKIIAIARAWKNDKSAPDSMKVNRYYLVSFVASARPITTKFTDGLLALMDSAVEDVKAAALAEAWRSPDRRIARELLVRLDRTSTVGTWGREGDLAASGLKRMVRAAGSVDFRDGPESQREAMKNVLRKTLENEASIDWPALVRQADEDIAKER
jgi:hypothetical protein